jgi:hypothetical protein
MTGPYWNEEHWKCYRYKELEAIIKDNPITGEKLLNFISTSYIGVTYPFSDPSKDIGISCYYGCRNRNFFPNYQICLNGTISRNKQINTFAHELTHIFYRCGFSSDSKEGLLIEDLIEKESLLLASKHRPLLASILKSLPKFYSLHPEYEAV